MSTHEKFMQEALHEARSALADNCYPVGAVLVKDGQVLARARKTMASNYLAHAETSLLGQVFKGNPPYKYPDELTIYTTLEPCIMCWGMMRHTPIARLVYAIEDPYGGCAHIKDESLPVRHHTRKMEVITGVCREDSRKLFRQWLDKTTEPFWLNGGAAEFQKIIKEPQ